MRNLQLLVILVLTIFTISLIQKEDLGSNQTQKKNIMLPTPAPASNAADATQTLIPTPASTPISTSIPSTSIPTPSSKIDISSFVYPGSIILNQSANEMTSQSTNDPQAITNWYREKIISLNMNAKSFVQTNTNGNVLNELVGVSARFKVKIQIEKISLSNVAAIKVSLK